MKLHTNVNANYVKPTTNLNQKKEKKEKSRSCTLTSLPTMSCWRCQKNENEGDPKENSSAMQKSVAIATWTVCDSDLRGENLLSGNGRARATHRKTGTKPNSGITNECLFSDCIQSDNIKAKWSLSNRKILRVEIQFERRWFVCPFVSSLVLFSLAFKRPPNIRVIYRVWKPFIILSASHLLRLTIFRIF